MYIFICSILWIYALNMSYMRLYFCIIDILIYAVFIFKIGKNVAFFNVFSRTQAFYKNDRSF